MATFGKESLARLKTMHPTLQTIFRIAIKILDFKILEGHRSNARQMKLYRTGVSKSKPGKSKHNLNPSWAGDVAPHPVEWPDKDKDSKMEFARKLSRFYLLAGVILAVAFFLRVNLKWGGSFKSFFDGPHFELVDDK